MQIPELPVLPPQIMETLEPVVQTPIKAQADIISWLMQRLTDLEQRLAQNSENSSKPPSAHPL
jgi:hypothetical protein